MRRFFVLLLVSLLLLPMVHATEQTSPLDDFVLSAWAREDVQKALDLHLLSPNVLLDLRQPISRGSFAGKAASLLALEFGSNMDAYLLIQNYRGLAREDAFPIQYSPDIGKRLGIIEGRENGDMDWTSSITRQEAAVMLARTYRAYHADIPEDLQELTFADQADIAPWAWADVQLMSHLGILRGNQWNAFEPNRLYSIEQCLVTLVRLYENAPADGSVQENPFAIPRLDEGFFHVWETGSYAFALETEDYYICAFEPESLGSGIGSRCYDIQIVEQDFSLRSYPSEILLAVSSRGAIHARPEHPRLSEDGTKLLYTANVPTDAYSRFWDAEGKETATLLFPKGIYTVTMDLKTGEQTYTHAELP